MKYFDFFSCKGVSDLKTHLNYSYQRDITIQEVFENLNFPAHLS